MRKLCLGLAVLLLAACSSAPVSERPVPLPHYSHDVDVRASWSHRYGAWSDSPEGRVQAVLVDGSLVAADGLDWLRAFDARNGDLRWERRSGVAITGGIAVDGNSFLIGTRHAQIVAYAMKDGKELWRRSLSSEILTPPTLSSDVVVVRSGDGKVYALNAADGKTLWTFERTVPTLSLRGTGRAVIDGDQVFVGFASGKLAALSLKDGSLLWEATVATPQGRSELERLVDVDADPVVKGDTVYAVAYHGRLTALSRSDGRVLWARDMSVYNNMAVDNHALYLSDAHGAVWAIDRASGAALWKQENLRNRQLSAPVVFGDHLVVADFEGYLHWLAKDDGRLVGRYHAADGPIVGELLPTDKLLYVQGRDGSIEALRTVDPQ